MPSVQDSSGMSLRAGNAFWIAAAASAALFSALVMLPSFLQRSDTEHPYHGIEILGPDAEVYYAARVQEVYDGFPNLGNTFLSAPKEQPAMQPPLPEQSIAAVGRLLGLDAIGAFLLAKIALSFTVFLAFVWLLFVVTGRPWVSLFSTTLVLEAGALLAAPWDLPLFLHPANASLEFLRFSRAVNPQWTGTFFLLELALLGLWIRNGKRLPLFAAAFGSLTLIYSYVYAWTYFFAAAGLVTVWFLFRKDWRRIADLAAFWVIIVAVITPYLIHLSVVMNHPLYLESSKRLGMVMRYGPPVFGVWCAVFIALGIASKALWQKSWPLLPALGIGGLIAFNQQLVTGHYIVPHHYNWYFIQPLASAVACAYLLSLGCMLFKSPVVRGVLAVVIVASAASVAFIQQQVAYGEVSDHWGRLQSAAPVIEYAAKNMRAGQVVYSQDVNILNLVPVYGSVDVYTAGNANLALVSDERSRYAYFFDLWLQGVTVDQAIRDFPTIRRWMLSSRIHAIYYREAEGDFAAMPDDEVRQHIEAYKTFYSLPLREKLSRYPLTAVITTPGDPQNRIWDAFLSCSKEVFAQNGYGLRMMIPAGYPKSCL